MEEVIRIKSITDVHDVFGFEKPKHPLVSVLPIDDRMTGYNYDGQRFTFDFYQISLKEGIPGSWVYGRNSYDFQEGTVVFMRPDQVVKIENNEATAGESGWTLLFHPDLIRSAALGQSIDQFSFFDYSVHEALHLSDDEKKALTELTGKIKDEYSQNIDKHSQDLIIANIELLLKYCQRYYDRQFYTRTNLNKDFISRFEKVIKDYYRSDQPATDGVLSVRYCADVLNMSSNYLGDLVRSETGQSAKEHIQGHIIEKAKTKIMGSNESISQIAYGLGFEYPQSFNKLFKAKTGMSPSTYRSRN